MGGQVEQVVDASRQRRMLVPAAVLVGLTAGIILGFRIIAPLVFS